MELWVVREMGMMGGRCEKNRFNGYLKKKIEMHGGMEDDHVYMVPMHVGM